MTVKKCAYDTGLLKDRMLNQTIVHLLDVIDKNVCKNDGQSAVYIKNDYSREIGLDCLIFSHFLKECLELGGHCETVFDAYYLESLICFILGFMWLISKRQAVIKLERLPKTVWKIPDAFINKILASK